MKHGGGQSKYAGLQIINQLINNGAMTRTRHAQGSRRSAGRPGGDRVDQRARLLDAAIARFARDGIGATSLRAIAADADVTPAMLHYYFGDKEQLKQALIAERLQPTMQSIRERLTHSGDDPSALIGTFVHSIGEAVARHPWLPSLWVREVLCEGGELREVLFDDLLPNMPHILADRFAAAQTAGDLNPRLDPRLLVVSLMGLTMFPAAGAPIWQRVFDARDVDPEALLKHTLALLQEGLMLPSSGETA